MKDKAPNEKINKDFEEIMRTIDLKEIKEAEALDATHISISKYVCLSIVSSTITGKLYFISSFYPGVTPGVTAITKEDFGKLRNILNKNSKI